MSANNNAANWLIVFNLKEFKYLNEEHLMELRECSKLLSDKLIMEDYKTFMVEEFNMEKNYKSFLIDESVNSNLYFNPFEPVRDEIKTDVERFSNDLKLVSTSKYYKLEIKYQIDYLYAYKLVESFNCVSYLELAFCHIPLNLLQFIFSNLSLLILEIHKNVIYINSEDFIVELPQTLVKLIYYNCYTKFIQNEGEPVKIMKHDSLHSDLHFLLNPQYLPNLKYFEYTDFHLSDTTNFDGFLALNPQLKSIKADLDFLHKNNLQVISLNNQLERLEISWYGNLQFPDFKYPIIYSLKSLDCVIFDEYQCTFNLLPYCPNLEYLKINVYFMDQVYSGINLAGKLKNLKKIVLNLRQKQLFKSLLKFPLMNSLEEIEFIQFNPDKIDFESLEKLPKLKFVKFYGRWVDNVKKKFGGKIQKKGNWKIIYYNFNRVYHRA
ncbi:hypothetical protein CONCODRAFT_19827 [Conidiobolus coronatus NRRL 28638]|uniref:F-box domain-containing protein n=1 Tax=Conidiobolus coronatus (strain ATCC 28846 / CBS 209.66 / NRRL 28638) TaxID=796925 RepID=A0A137NWC4_CONC2|nr:hypothetical protein CONCODRAFT_19827 [Conidiobolus coronatus NRRL 28638]|eukprot:KXN67130.1 hypothetical protein CONCODRAFT_19827 [Conidiobolus coronatus NRRL 28638]